MTDRTLAQLAKEAIDLQDACNPLGLSIAYAQSLSELADLLRQAGNFSTDLLRFHPINRMWAYKLCDLAQADDENFSRAYQACKELASAGSSEQG